MLEVNRKSTLVHLWLRDSENTGFPQIGNPSSDYEVLSTIYELSANERLMTLRVYADFLIIESSAPKDYNLYAEIRFSSGVRYSLINQTPDPVTSVAVPLAGEEMFIEASQPSE